MKKYIILIIVLVLCILIAGCGNKKNSSAENKDEVKETVASQEPEKEEKPDYSVFSGEYAQEESIKQDYKFGTTVSLEINEEGNVKGEITSAADNASHIASVDFTGKVNDGIIESSFDEDGWEHSGKIKIELQPDGINLTLTYNNSQQNNGGLWGIGEGTFKMINKNTKIQRTLQDLIDGGFLVIEESTFNTKFDNFGYVKFISGMKREYGCEIFAFYIADENNNILYKLSDFTGNDTGFGYNIDCVAFYDLNKDGLKDILIIASYKNFEGNILPKAGIYFQNGNEFVQDEELNYELNTSGKNYNLENVLIFMENR